MTESFVATISSITGHIDTVGEQIRAAVAHHDHRNARRLSRMLGSLRAAERAMELATEYAEEVGVLDTFADDYMPEGERS